MKNRTKVLGGGGDDVAKNNNLTTPNEQDNCKNKQDNCYFLQNNENIKLNKKKQSVAEAVRRRNSRTKENSDYGTTSTKQVKYVKQAKSEAVHHRTFVLSLLTLVLSVLVLALSFTYSQLSASKTATGNITFTLESPAITYETPLNFKYENGTMTYGLTTDGGTDLSSVPYNITIDSDNILSSYYALVGFQFIDASTNAEITSGITFGASPSFGSVAMSALSYDATYNSFVSKTPTAVAKGSKLNLMSYFGIMNLSNLSATTIKVRVLLILDKSSNFQSVNRTQNTFVANVEIKKIPMPSVFELGSDWSNFYFNTVPSTNGFSGMHVIPYKTGNAIYNGKNNYTALTINISANFYFKVEFDLNCNFLLNNNGADITESNWTWSSNKLYSSVTVDNITYLVEFVNDSSGKTTMSITSLTLSSGTVIDFGHIIGIGFSGYYGTINVPYGTNFNESKMFMSTTTDFSVINVKFYSSNDLNNMQLISGANVNYRIYDFEACVVGDTKVATGFNGEYKFAKDIVAGDEVLTFNMTTFEWELCKVTSTFSHKVESTYKVELSSGDYIQLTSGHPIYTRRGWAVCDSSRYDHDMLIYPEILQKQDLQVGDKVKCQNDWVEITRITKIDGEIDVYSITIEGNHNYVGGGMLVHNWIS